MKDATKMQILVLLPLLGLLITPSIDALTTFGKTNPQNQNQNPPPQPTPGKNFKIVFIPEFHPFFFYSHEDRVLLYQSSTNWRNQFCIDRIDKQESGDLSKKFVFFLYYLHNFTDEAWGRDFCKHNTIQRILYREFYAENWCQ